MAVRRGRFGRLPRSAPNLSSTIISIAREMQAQRERNLMDAWEKGGMFEGRPATDEVVLAYWRGRLNDVDRDDPLYDQYKNTVFQFEYAIGESKASTAYAQGKLSDAGMAQFYLNWARKVPKNSEFYRALQRDAAQFMRAARARGRASASKAKDAAYQAAQERDYQRNERAGEYLTNVMRDLAAANGLIGTGESNDLWDFDPNDPGRMMQLLDSLNGRSEGDRDDKSSDMGSVLFRDRITGEAVTAADVQRRLKELDPSFDGRVTVDYIRSAVRRQLDSQGVRLQRAEAGGYKEHANQLRNMQERTSEVGREVALWPVQESYLTSRKSFLSTWLSPTSTPDEKLAAWDRYSRSLTRLASAPDIDLNTRSRLLAEVNGDGSVKSLAEDFTGLGNADNTTTSGEFSGDIAETAFDVQRLARMQQAVASGAAVWTTGVTERDGTFRPAAGGPEVGAATVDQVQAASAVPVAVMFVPQSGGAKTIPVVVPGANVYATARDERGLQVPMTNQNPVASYYDVRVGGQSTRVYAYTAANGRTMYTTDAPWDERFVSVRSGENGMTVDLSAYVPRKNEAGEWVYANGQRADVSGASGWGLEQQSERATTPQRVVFDPAAATVNTDPARVVAGPDPLTDSFSPTLAALIGTEEGRRTIQVLKDDPVFRATIERDIRLAATDPLTGAVDQSLVSRYTLQSQIVQNPTIVTDFVGNMIQGARSLWDRVTTSTTFRATEDRRRPTEVSLEARDERAAAGKLPSDQVRETPFSALARAFMPGTTQVVRPGAARQEGAGIELQVKGQIRVPQPPAPPSVSPRPAPAPAPAPAPTKVEPAPLPGAQLPSTAPLPGAAGTSSPANFVTGFQPSRPRFGPY